MALIRATSGSGGGSQVYQTTTFPTGGRFECGFQPKHILMVANSTQAYGISWDISDATHFIQYWGTTAYTYDVTPGGSGHGLTAVDSTGFNVDTNYVYAGKFKEVLVIG